MTVPQQLLTIAAVVLGTMATRFLPFLIFPRSRRPNTSSTWEMRSPRRFSGFWWSTAFGT